MANMSVTHGVVASYVHNAAAPGLGRIGEGIDKKAE